MSLFSRLVVVPFLFSLTFLNAQILYEYPEGQDFYKKGIIGLNADIKKVIKKEKLKGCDEGDFQQYTASVLINEDGNIKFVKDFDTIAINNNKCAYDFAKKVLPHLKGWIPAKVDKEKVPAIAKIIFTPNLLFANKNEKFSMNTPPVFRSGKERFDLIIKDILEKELGKNVSGRQIYINVFISELGKIEDVKITSSEADELKNEKIASLIKSIKGEWTPGKRYGKPINYRLNYKFTQEFNFDLERKKEEELWGKPDGWVR